MGRDDAWVCGNCRAINDRRSSRCYSCRAPRALAFDSRTGVSPIQAGDRTAPAELARIAREGGATYRSSALRATVVLVAIVVVTGLHVARLGPLVQVLPFYQQIDARQFGSIDQQAFNLAALNILTLQLAEAAAWILGFIAWGAWLSRVVANVPALGGGWTRSSPREALLSSIVPIYNLYWMPAAVRDAVARLSSPKAGRDGLVSAWWLTLVIAVLPGLGLLPGPMFRIRLAVQIVGFVLVVLVFVLSTTPYAVLGVYSVLYTLLLVPAALLAIAVVRHIETLQSARVAALVSEAPADAPSTTPPAESPTRNEHLTPELPDLGPHGEEVDAFIESLDLMNRDEAGQVHRQGLASGAGGGSRWASLDRQLDAAAGASGLGPARLEAQRRATRTSARSHARVGNRYVIADECAGVWAAVLVLRDHLDRGTAAMAFEPWEDVLVRPEWL